MTTERTHLSIGEVLALLKEEFPDITISKIRFLESQGLLDPERTPSGYRKFYENDVETLRFILRQQREHFLPLKVIKGRLGEVGAAGGEADSGGDVAVVDTAPVAPASADPPAATRPPNGGRAPRRNPLFPNADAAAPTAPASAAEDAPAAPAETARPAAA